MTQKEKVEMLKETISDLYEKEGRSKKYIAELLKVERKVISDLINKENMIKADEKHLSPSKQKFLNKHRKEIIDMLDSDISMTDISDKLNVSRTSLLKTYIKKDKELLHHYDMYNKRKDKNSKDRMNKLMDISGYDYDIQNLKGEKWKDILGYPGYQVSNKGRIKSYSKTYKSYHLLTPTKNSISGRLYISLLGEDKKRHNLILARIVAHAFVKGYSEINNTVDHIDGDFTNNNSENLEWVSQKENNIRAINLGKPGHKAYSKNKKFKSIILDETYEFKTIRALSKFMNISESQVQRYLDGSSKTNHTFTFKY